MNRRLVPKKPKVVLYVLKTLFLLKMKRALRLKKLGADRMVQERPLLLALFLQALKNFDLVRNSNPRSLASQTSKNPDLCQKAVRNYKLLRAYFYVLKEMCQFPGLKKGHCYSRFFSTKSAD